MAELSEAYQTMLQAIDRDIRTATRQPFFRPQPGTLDQTGNPGQLDNPGQMADLSEAYQTMLQAINRDIAVQQQTMSPPHPLSTPDVPPKFSGNPHATKMRIREHGRPFQWQQHQQGSQPMSSTDMCIREHGQPFSSQDTSSSDDSDTEASKRDDIPPVVKDAASVECAADVFARFAQWKRGRAKVPMYTKMGGPEHGQSYKITSTIQTNCVSLGPLKK